MDDFIAVDLSERSSICLSSLIDSFSSQNIAPFYKSLAGRDQQFLFSTFKSTTSHSGRILSVSITHFFHHFCNLSFLQFSNFIAIFMLVRFPYVMVSAAPCFQNISCLGLNSVLIICSFSASTA